MKLPSNVIYSEWSHSDWHVYWDTTLGKGKNNQIICYRHITEDKGYVEYSVGYVWTAIKNGNFRKAFNQLKTLTDSEHNELIRLTQDFLADVDAYYNR